MNGTAEFAAGDAGSRGVGRRSRGGVIVAVGVAIITGAKRAGLVAIIVAGLAVIALGLAAISVSEAATGLVVIAGGVAGIAVGLVLIAGGARVLREPRSTQEGPPRRRCSQSHAEQRGPKGLATGSWLEACDASPALPVSKIEHKETFGVLAAHQHAIVDPVRG